MKRNKAGAVLAAAVVLLGALLFTACPDGGGGGETQYKVTTSATNGTITVNPAQGTEGTEITVTVQADTGYKYTAGTLKYNDIPIGGSSNPYTFNLPGTDVTVTAAFEALAEGEYNVIIGTISGGTVTAASDYGKEGDTIELTVNPDTGDMILKSLTYTVEGSTPVDITGTSFIMPGAHVTIDAVFEAADTTELLAYGVESLQSKNWDAAIGAFESAWEQAPTNSNAIVFSTLGKLASIAKSTETRNFMTKRLGIKDYPGTINKLISTDWMTEYTVDEGLIYEYLDTDNHWVEWHDDSDTRFFEEYGLDPKPGYYKHGSGDVITFVSDVPKFDDEGATATQAPGLDTPDWFKDSIVHNASLTTKDAPTMMTFNLLLIANLIENNTDGLNGALDELLTAAFGSNFEDAYARIENLTEPVELTSATLADFGLDEFYEGESAYIGKAELQVLFSALRIVKAGLEWVSAYDWNTDLNFLKDKNIWDGKLDQAAKPASLPLQNNFLKKHSNGDQRMENSKADFIKAIDDIIAAYDSIIAGDKTLVPPAYKEELTNFEWAKDGLSQLKTAITGGTKFYWPEQTPTGTTFTNTETGAWFGIDLGKLFTPGQLSLDKLIENEEGKPVFYGYHDSYDSDGSGDSAGSGFQGTRINVVADMEGYTWIGFKFKTTPITDIIVLGYEFEGTELEFSIGEPDGVKTIWEWYNN